MPRLFLIAAISYLLGSIPFGYLLVRIFRGEDVKGSTAVAVGIVLSPTIFERIPISHIPWRTLLPAASPEYATSAALAALFAVVGHIFPIWLKFRGGKGVATGLGAFVLIAPKAVLVSAAIFLVLVLIFRYVSRGSIAAVAAFPNLALVLHEYGNNSVALVLMATASVLIIVKHHANLRRLLAGTENRLGSKHA